MAYKDPEVAVQMAGEKQREENKRKWRAYKIELKPDRWMVCSGENGIDGVAKMVDDNQEANAYLIAAAPEMYEALKHTKGWLTTMNAYIPLHGIVEKIIDEALTKAKGG